MTGLKGANCYHDFHPFIKGVSKRTYTDEELDRMNEEENIPKKYGDKEYTTYEALQRQRKLETTMRAQRQEIHLLKTGNASEEDILNAQSRYRVASAEYTRFSEQMGLPQQRERVTIDGLGKIGVNSRFVIGKTVAKSSESGIIELSRRKGIAHRHIGSRGQQIIDKATYNKLTRDFIKSDGLIIRGETAAKHLGEGRYASYLPSLNTTFIRDDATISDVLEEMYHAKQDRLQMFGDTLTEEVLLRREIDAQEYLLSLTNKYKIPDDEVETTKGNLEYYKTKLLKLMKEEG